VPHAGGATAEAFASAYSAALGRDPSGCLVLTEARAYAYARCGQGGSFSSSGSEVTSRVLGFCAQRTGGFPPLPGFPPPPPFPFFQFPALPSLFGPGRRRGSSRRLLRRDEGEVAGGRGVGHGAAAGA
jgi:hypothetical protein